jgi:hypothetical protein
MSGLSCILFPFLPLSPHRLCTASSCSLPALMTPWPARSRFGMMGVLCVEAPRIAVTDECAQRVCLRIADVTVMHSVTTSATGLTATEMGRPCCALGPASRLGVVSWCVAGDAASLPAVDIIGERVELRVVVEFRFICFGRRGASWYRWVAVAIGTAMYGSCGDSANACVKGYMSRSAGYSTGPRVMHLLMLTYAWGSLLWARRQPQKCKSGFWGYYSSCWCQGETSSRVSQMPGWPPADYARGGGQM